MNGQAGKFLALGITLGLLGLLWIALVAPLIDWHAGRADELAQRRQLLLHMQAMAASLPALRQAGGAAVSAIRAPSALLDGDTDAVAAASLQQKLQDMAGRVGANVASAETLPASQVGNYRKIALHVSLNASWSVLVGLLQAIHQAVPFMLVDDLQVHSARMLMQPADPSLGAAFTVYAFRAGTVPAQGARVGAATAISLSGVAAGEAAPVGAAFGGFR